MQVVQKDLIGPDGHAGEGAKGGAGGARSNPKTGNKAWLRRRLHGAIVRAHLAEPYRMDFYRFVTWVKLLPF